MSKDKGLRRTSEKPASASADERKARAAEALRQNLRRRKAQARGRKAAEAEMRPGDTPDGS